MRNGSKADWSTIKTEYIQEPQLTQRTLAEKYGVSSSTLAYRCMKEGWTAQREDFSRKYQARLNQLALATNAPQLIKESNEKQLKWNEEMRWIINSRLKMRDEKGKIVVRPDITLNDAWRATITMIELYRCDRLALGASTDNVQPVVTRDRFAEMTDEELAAEWQRVSQRPTIQ